MRTHLKIARYEQKLNLLKRDMDDIQAGLSSVGVREDNLFQFASQKILFNMSISKGILQAVNELRELQKESLMLIYQISVLQDGIECNFKDFLYNEMIEVVPAIHAYQDEAEVGI